MREVTTYWAEGEVLEIVPAACELPGGKNQPRIGIEMGWNIPKKWWKPFIILHLLHKHYQFGWLA